MQTERITEEFCWICPLYAFKYKVAGPVSIDFCEGVSICSMTTKLRNHMNKAIPELYLDLNNVGFVMQITHNPLKRRPPEVDYFSETKALEPSANTQMIYDDSIRSDAANIAVDLITSLRLQHKGDVAFGPLLAMKRIDGDFAQTGTTHWSSLSKSSDYFIYVQEDYELDEGEVGGLKTFWNDYRQKRRQDKLNDIEIALRRFNSSYGEKIEDRLIDHMIALESLYLSDEKELRYKLALRAAFLLSPNEGSRVELYKRLKFAYDYRSKIVHGGREKPSLQKEDKLKELLVDTEEYLRKSIIRFMELTEHYPLKDLTDHYLDEHILKAGSLLK